MNKFTISVLSSLMLDASLSALADDSMKGMDMSKIPMSSNGGAASSMSTGSMNGMEIHFGSKGITS